MTVSFERLLLDTADRFPHNTAIASGQERITYSELEALALEQALHLRNAGARPGKPVIVVVPNSIAFLIAYFAAWFSGATVVCLNPSAPRHELAAILDVTGPTAAVVARSVGDHDLYQDLADLLPAGTIWIDDLDAHAVTRQVSRDLVFARTPESVGFLAFTSGSTGRPKGAALRTDTLVATSQHFAQVAFGTVPPIVPTTFPLYNMGGLSTIVPVVMSGGTLVIMDGFSGPKLVSAIEEYQATFAMLTPAMAELYFLRGKPGEHDQSSLESVLLCAAPISNRLCKRLAAELHVTVIIGYALTEVPGAWMTTRRDTSLDEIGPFVGWPIEGYELAIRGDDNQSLPQGIIGEVCVRTVRRLSEYIGDPDLTEAAIDKDGFMHSGDLGYLRPDGGLVIRGRKKEMYIRGGFNVYPREVEEALVEHPDITLAVVHSVDDPILGEKGYAWIVPEVGSNITVEEVRAFAAQRLSSYKVPDQIRIIDVIPLSPIGKVDKVTLRTRAMSEGGMTAADRR